MSGFTNATFNDPPARYRGCPLWSWNSSLEWSRLKDQIDDFQQMGLGGFTMHSRVGLDTPYLGDHFMSMVERSIEYAKEKGLQACLYDEDRWPSGAAGGLALKDHPEFRANHLLITPRPYGTTSGKNIRASAKAARSENGRLVARIELFVHPDDTVSFQNIPLDSVNSPTSSTRYVYLESNPPSEWFNGETYIDTLSQDAMSAFIKSTHDKYRSKVGKDFGETVPTMFTDEPQFAHKTLLAHSLDDQDIFLPWTDDLESTFAETHADDLVQRVAELVWDVKGGDYMRRRWEFADHVCERFVSAFVDQMSLWCQEAGLKLTGHMMNEPTLLSQTIAIGEAMRGYRSMHIPGVDMLCERTELNTVKQCTSVARQQQGGPAWAVSEIYGVTNWTMTFEKHKLLGDWQAALGINWRVHHLSPVSMKGEAKRDYPAAIAYQSPWYKEYRYIEDHFARVNLALTTGSAVTRVAVIHPIESFWLCVGPLRNNMKEMTRRDVMFRELAEWLLYGLVDFDYIAESLLPSQIGEISSTLSVGHCRYDVVIVPNLKTIRRSTLDVLNSFSKAGGRVVIAGSAPTMVDARMIDQVELQGERVDFSSSAVLDAVDSSRDVSAVDEYHMPTRTLLHQLRQEGDAKWLFVSNLDRLKTVRSSISVKGVYDVTVLDTLSGEEWALISEVSDGWTSFKWVFDGCGSLLVRLDKRAGINATMQINAKADYLLVESLKLNTVHLDEPNALMLDYAEWCIDDKWMPSIETLRIGNLVRARLGLPLKGEAAAQPYTLSEEDRRAKCDLYLRYEFHVNEAIESPVDLAIELADGVEIKFDDDPVSSDVIGWWVDKDISRVRLCPSLSVGKHTVLLKIPFGAVSHTERIYLLGDFGVDLRGDRAVITRLEQDKLYWGNHTRQGLPFYAGNVKYECSLTTTTSDPIAIELPRFEAPVITVQIGSEKRTIATPPYMGFFDLPTGEHQVVITCFGNRENAFGMSHLMPGKTWWCSPNEWRTEGDEWVDEYQIKPMGVLVAPRLRVRNGEKVISKWLNRDRPVHILIADPVGGPILGPKPL